jgi:hypothetical protein
MPFRTVRMTLFNMTNDSLDKTSDHLDHGAFTDPFQPPQEILPDQFGQWRAESDGVIPILGSLLTGTDGSVDYVVRNKGDQIHFDWDNPAVGKTTFKFPAPIGAANASSDYVFFPIHIALDLSKEPDPVLGAPVVAVFEGDVDDDGLILPLPGQETIRPHAFFAVGLRNRRDPVSLRRWFKALNLDPRQGLRQLLIKHISVRALLELPFG